MSKGIKQLSRELAKASKEGEHPVTIKQAEFVVKTVFQLMSEELAQPDGRVELENFMVFQNKPYIRTGINTRRIEFELSPELKKRLNPNTSK